MNTNKFTPKYVIAHSSVNPYDSDEKIILYDTDTESFYGGIIYDMDINHAKIFDSFEAVLTFVMNHKSRYEYGFSIVEICDAKLEAIENNKELRYKYSHDAHYVFRG